MTLQSEENPENLTISVWFECRSCQFTFPFSTVHQFLDHKRMEHFSELEKTQCIVFEERKLDALSQNQNDEGQDVETKLFADDESKIDGERCSNTKKHGVFSSLAETSSVVETSSSIPAPASTEPVHEEKAEPSLIASHTNESIEAIEAAAAPGQEIDPESNAEFNLFSIRSWSPDNNDMEADQQPHGSTTLNNVVTETNLEPNNLSSISSQILSPNFPFEKNTDDVYDEAEVITDAENDDVKYVPEWNSESPAKNPYVLIRRLTSKELLPSGNLRASYNRKCKRKLTTQKTKKGKISNTTSTLEKRFQLKLKRSKLKKQPQLNQARNAQLLMCDICGKVFTRNYRLTDHLLTHGEERRVKCTHPNCTKAFKSKSNLYSHLKCHNDSKLFACPKDGCSSPGFKTKSDLRKHLKLSVIHNGVSRPKPWRCCDCGKLFGKKVGLDQHMISAHGFRPQLPQRTLEWLECQICQKKFPSKSRLRVHVKKTHSQDRPFKCTYEGCDKAYKDKNTLTEHTNGKHTGERPHQCDLCGKAFYLLWSFKFHMKIHQKSESA